VMRDNAQTLSNLAKARSEHAKTATAIDDLKSYAEISEAHAAGTRRMIPVFQALYDHMSPEQKTAADAEFREHFHEHQHHAH
jgi:protein CpxP